MISVLAQERVLGAALGSSLAGFVVFEERKRIYESISNNRSRVSARNQIQEPIFGKNSRSGLAHTWNQTVDKTLGPVIEYLSSHGCGRPRVNKREEVGGKRSYFKNNWIC